VAKWGLHKNFEFVVTVCKLIFYMLLANHLGACIWQVCGTAATDGWYAARNVEEDHDRFDYSLAFYWSATIMTTGASMLMPTNTSEIWCIIIFAIFGFIFTSVMISSLLAAVMDYQDRNRQRSEKLKTLRQFLLQHNVDSTLSLTLQREAKERIFTNKRLSEQDVTALYLISPLKRSELWYSIYRHRIADNAFIRTVNIVTGEVIKEICFCAVALNTYEPGTFVFEPQMKAMGAYLVCCGSLEYLSRTQSNSNAGFPADSDANLTSLLSKGHWVSEMALWTHWVHRGWLEVTTPSELLTVQADAFMKVMSGHQDLAELLRDYSKSLLALVQSSI